MLILIFFICLIVIEEIAECLYKNTNRYKSSLGGADKLKTVPGDIEICNVGSGPGLYAICYENCERKGFNFSTAPQSFDYGFKLLKHFSKKIKKDAIIMCPLSFGSNDDYKRKDYSDKFYGILSPSEIDNFSFMRSLMLTHPLLIGILRKVKRLFNKQEKGQALAVCEKEPAVVTGWKRQFQLENLEDETQSSRHKKAFEDKISLLDKEVKYCKEQGWKPVLIVPPVPENTRKFISEDFAKEFVFNNIKSLQDLNPSLKCLSYYDDYRFVDSMYQNDVFMNSTGRQEFKQIQ